LVMAAEGPELGPAKVSGAEEAVDGGTEAVEARLTFIASDLGARGAEEGVESEGEGEAVGAGEEVDEGLSEPSPLLESGVEGCLGSV
jgi:hypothetical protein